MLNLCYDDLGKLNVLMKFTETQNKFVCDID